MGNGWGTKDFLVKCGDCQSDHVSPTLDLESLAIRSKLSYNEHKEGKYFPKCEDCGSEAILLEFPIHLDAKKEKQYTIQTCYSNFLTQPTFEIISKHSPHNAGILHFMDLNAANSFRSQTYQWATGGNTKMRFPLLLQRIQDSKIPEDQVGSYWEIFNWSVPHLTTKRHDLSILGEWNDFQGQKCRMLIPPQIGFFMGIAAPQKTSEQYLGGGTQIYIPKQVAQLCFNVCKTNNLQNIIQNPENVFKEALKEQKKYEDLYLPAVRQVQKEKKIEQDLFTKCSNLESKVAKLTSMPDEKVDAQNFLARNKLCREINSILKENENLLNKFPNLKENLNKVRKKLDVLLQPKPYKEIFHFRKYEKWNPGCSWENFLKYNKDMAEINLDLVRLGFPVEDEDPDDPICSKCGHRMSEHPVRL